MSLIQVSVAAAVAVLGVDLLSDAVGRSSTIGRRINYIGLAGSAAALDTTGRLMAGEREIATVFNSSTGAVTRDDRFAIGQPLGANEELRFIITDAPATNPINLVVDVT